MIGTILIIFSFLKSTKDIRLSLQTVFLLVALAITSVAQAEISTDTPISTCESVLVSQDIEKRYDMIQSQLELDYKVGAPQKLRSALIKVRRNIDDLTLAFFDIDTNNPQEVNLFVQKTLDQVDNMIGLVPQASDMVPQMRSQYVVPFTNMNSIKADHQDCKMKLAIAQAKAELDSEKNPDSNQGGGNVYKKLTSELNQLNQNLYQLETTNVQKYIALRSELLKNIERYNKGKQINTDIAKKIPNILNSVQSEIEKMLPGLQLSKQYYSLAH